MSGDERQLPPGDRSDVEGPRPGETFTQFLERKAVEDHGLPPLKKKEPTVADELDERRKARTERQPGEEG